MAIDFGLFRAALIAAAVGLASGAVAAPKAKPSKPFEIGDGDLANARGVVGLKKGGAMFAVGEGLNVYVRPVDAKGKTKNAIQLNVRGQSEFGIERAKLALLKNGNVAAIWVGRPDGKSTTLVRVVKPDGTGASSEVTASAIADSVTHSEVSVAALSNGGFAAAWYDLDFNGDVAIQARAFNAGASPQGVTATIKPPSGARIGAPYVAPFGKGFILVYAQSGPDEGIYAQLFNAAAKRSGKPFQLDKPNDLTPQTPRVLALQSGGVAVLWRENTISTVGGLPIVADAKLAGVFLDKKGKIGKRFGVNDDIRDRSIENSAAFAETKAGLLVAWSMVTTTTSDDVDIRGAFVSSSGKVGSVISLTNPKASRELGSDIASMQDGSVALGYAVRKLGDTDTTPAGAFGAYLKVSGK